MSLCPLIRRAAVVDDAGHHEGCERAGALLVAHGAEHAVAVAAAGDHAYERAARIVGRGGTGEVELRQFALAVGTDGELVGEAENGLGEAVFIIHIGGLKFAIKVVKICKNSKRLP